MTRWTKEEHKILLEVRKRCSVYINESPQYPEIIGDRKILRFIRGHNNDIDKICYMYINCLEWRKNSNINIIRDNIINKDMNHPSKFPHAEVIMKLMPHDPILPYSKDKKGSPICIEQYNFSPAIVLKQIPIDDYINFSLYCLEFRSLILEQISEENEKEYLNSLDNNEDSYLESLEPYGVLATVCKYFLIRFIYYLFIFILLGIIRDLDHISFEHISSQGQEIIKAVISVSSDNYPEMMRSCYMINSPWLFNTIWYFIKGLLSVRTINKIKVLGKSYIEEIKKEIDLESLPVDFGGNLGKKDISYNFNKSYFNSITSSSPPTTTTNTTTVSSPVSVSIPTSTSITEEYLHLRLLSTYA
jgi:hypothetical protein